MNGANSIARLCAAVLKMSLGLQRHSSSLKKCELLKIPVFRGGTFFFPGGMSFSYYSTLIQRFYRRKLWKKLCSCRKCAPNHSIRDVWCRIQTLFLFAVIKSCACRFSPENPVQCLIQLRATDYSSNHLRFCNSVFIVAVNKMQVSIDTICTLCKLYASEWLPIKSGIYNA